MFQRILIANRGEIACRILRTARALGVETVAVHAQEDRHAPFVALADTAVSIDVGPSTERARGAGTPVACYLDGEAIIEAALRTGAEAIHPGYGFLAENAQFAEAVAAAGLTFIGPPAPLIASLGDKLNGRRLAASVGVPVAPAVALEPHVEPATGAPVATADRADSRDARLRQFCATAARLGFPLLLKAAAGGGGRGMHTVRSQAELEALAPLASGEALAYFGDGQVYAERLVERPRHVEVQVFGDTHGTLVHLGERDCSVQRRFQKLVEETPAPGLSADLRARIHAAALAVASHAGYVNAGTVEFVVAPDGQFYFLEMNTRLQVEHVVTEQVTGLDLVALQLRVAAGEPLGFQQADVRLDGHAIEVRICAEVPEADFAPASGRVLALTWPEGPGVRVDSGVARGTRIGTAFDSLLAKLAAHGPDRAVAGARLARALDEHVLLGVTTNADFLARLIRSPAFAAAAVHTDFVLEQAAALAQPAPTDAELQVVLSAAVLALRARQDESQAVPEPYASMGEWRN